MCHASIQKEDMNIRDGATLSIFQLRNPNLNDHLKSHSPVWILIQTKKKNELFLPPTHLSTSLILSQEPSLLPQWQPDRVREKCLLGTQGELPYISQHP